MSTAAAILRKGWCPGALRPMQSGDGLIVRVRPRVGRLSLDAAGAMADLAARGVDVAEVVVRADIRRLGRQRPLDVRDALVAAAADLEARALLVDRREEREALDVVPVEVGDQGEAVEGAVGTDVVSVEPQARAEVGFALARAPWGRRYGREALTALLDHAFGTLALRRIEADVDPRNLPSLETLESLGFRREGYLRQRWQVNGEVQDSVIMGLLASDWRAND